LYLFLEGTYPFRRQYAGQEEEKRVCIEICQQEPKFKRCQCPKAQDLIRKLLAKRPEARIQSHDIFLHPFMSDPDDGIPWYCLPQRLSKNIMLAPISQDLHRQYVQEAKVKREKCHLANQFVKVNAFLAVENRGVGFLTSIGTVGQITPNN
jgi:serine/threonine protein kinase